MTAKAGDRIVVETERTGQVPREGEILEVLSPGPNVHYRVRWADGHETTFFPSAGNATIVPRSKAGAGTR
jgi:hypothetical protein